MVEAFFFISALCVRVAELQATGKKLEGACVERELVGGPLVAQPPQRLHPDIVAQAKQLGRCWRRPNIFTCQKSRQLIAWATAECSQDGAIELA
jgi:hypothetical protein